MSVGFHCLCYTREGKERERDEIMHRQRVSRNEIRTHGFSFTFTGNVALLGHISPATMPGIVQHKGQRSPRLVAPSAPSFNPPLFFFLNKWTRTRTTIKTQKKTLLCL